MSSVRLEMVFDGDPVDIRNVADAMRDGLERAQRAGRFDNVQLLAGPTVSTGSKEQALSVADYLQRNGSR